jgi:hypothetical protein
MPRYNRQQDFEAGLAQVARFFDSLSFSTTRVEPYRDKEGTFYSARFVRPPRTVEFVHLYSLGPVTYSIREFFVEHTYYTKALGHSAEARFPSFDDDSVSGYAAWIHDLANVISPFFKGPEPQFVAIASRYMEEQREQLSHDAKKLNYESIQEPRLKAHARALFFQGRYGEVVRLESQLRFPEFLSAAERQLFALARRRQVKSTATPNEDL